MGRSVEAGRAVLKLLLDDKELNKKFADTQRKLRNVGRSVRSAGLQIGGIGAAITAPFALATSQFIKVGDELNKMSARTGVSVEALSELKFAAEQSGASLSDVEKAVRTMQRSLLDAEQGTATAVDALSQLGIKLEDIKGQSPETQFELISKRIAEIEDPSRRAAAAMEIFGRSGQVLLPMLGDMEKLRAEARELGLVIDEETAQSAADLADSFNRVSKTVSILAVHVGAALAPALIDLADLTQGLVRITIGFIRRNKTLVIVVAAVGATLAALGTTLVTVGALISAAAIGIVGLTKALVVLRVGLTLLAAHPIIAALLVIGGIVAWLTDGFGLLGDAVEESGEKLDDVAGIKPGATGSTADRRQELAAESAKAQRALEQQISTTVTAPTLAPSQPNQVDRNMLSELVQLKRIAIDQLTAMQNGGFVAGSR